MKVWSLICDSKDGSPPGSSVHGILQARMLEWVAMPSARGLPNSGIEPKSSALQADSLPSEPPEKPYIKVSPLELVWLSSWMFAYFCT